MPKRIRYFICFILCSVLLSGCSSVVDLTDEETKLIAEYAAEVLLKYDVNYTDRIDEGERETLQKENAADTEGSAADTVDETSATETIDTETKDTVSDSDNTEPSASSEGAEEDIAKIAGISGASITYKDYIITDQYPAAEEEDGFISLDASEGHKLLVVRFKVVNTTQDMLDISLLDKEIEYSIICNDDRTADAMLTILMEDLSTLEITLNPGEEQEAVLVFQISKDMENKLDSIKLKTVYNNTDNIINILD